MSFLIVFHTPLVFLLPVAGSVDARTEISGEPEASVSGQAAVQVEERPVQLTPFEVENRPSVNSGEFRSFRMIAESFRIAGAHQARIEQRMIIRVTPRTTTVQRNMLMDLPSREIGPRFVERRIGKCVAISGISGVQPEGGQELILYMRDRKIVSARLEHACRSRDFYSGFYLSRSSDGKLCVDRDTLQSRSGANCKLTRIRELVEVGN
ncbi:MAG: hypothetical protein KDE21_05590 [Novosphingobium sp.]|nr:hypothetical protein [Novosphingobium sp.]